MSEPARYAVGYESAARKELGKLDKQAARRIARAVSALGSNPRPAGCRRLFGYDDLWRIRIGDYRVVYTIKDAELTVLALRSPIAARSTGEADPRPISARSLTTETSTHV